MCWRGLGGGSLAACVTTWRGSQGSTHGIHAPLLALLVIAGSQVACDHMMGGMRASNESSPLTACSRRCRVLREGWYPGKCDHACRGGGYATDDLYQKRGAHTRQTLVVTHGAMHTLWHAWNTSMQAWWVRHDPPRRHDAASDEREHALASLIEPGKQPCCAGAVGAVLVAKLGAQQPLFRTDTREERREHERCEQHANSRTKGETPPQRVDE
jgi:hypothetical protein